MILYYKCSSLDREEIKLTNIMKIMNTKIKDNNKKKIIIIRKFLSKDIICQTQQKKHIKQCQSRYSNYKCDNFLTDEHFHSKETYFTRDAS